MPRRMYAGGAKKTTLVGTITSTATSITVDDATGYPSGANGNFWIVIDRGLSTEEKILCSATSGDTFTAVDRTTSTNRDGTTNQTHSDGAPVEHVYTADDANDANRHTFETTDDDHTQYLNVTRHDALAHVSGRDIDFWRWVDTDMRYGPSVAGTAAASTFADNTLFAAPFLERRGGTIDTLSLAVTTATGAGSARIGIYTTTSTTNLYPDALVVDSGALSVATIGTKNATISQVLAANTLYWLVFVHNAGLSAEYQAISPLDYYPSPLGMTSPMEDRQSHVRAAFTLGALPANYPAGGTYFAANVPVVGVRYSA